jgi:hypothetical protein
MNVHKYIITQMMIVNKESTFFIVSCIQTNISEHLKSNISLTVDIHLESSCHNKTLGRLDLSALTTINNKKLTSNL